MDISSINSMSSMLDSMKTSSGTQSANSLKNSLNSLSSESTEEELKGVIKEFEAYFVEQVIKKVKDTFTSEDEDADSTMSQYKDLYMDTAIQTLANEMVDDIGGNYTQQLYEQMKRNYNIDTYSEE